MYIMPERYAGYTRHVHVCMNTVITCMCVTHEHFVYLQRLSLSQTTFKGLDMFEFDDTSLSDDQTVMASVKMFSDSGLTTLFKIDEKVRCLRTSHMIAIFECT